MTKVTREAREARPSNAAHVSPNFLIVGAAKAGTTSLHAWLRQHPDVFLPEHKEPAHFCYTGIRMFDPDQYVALFGPGRGSKAIGEASTAYLTSPESARLIRARLGAIRIVILLRDPVLRAFSLYNWMIMEGFERLPTFERALQAEEGRFADPWFRDKSPGYFYNFMYFRSGLYAEQVARYLEIFGSESVKVCLFDDLVLSPESVYRDVCEFLGVATDFTPVIARHNVSRRPRFVRVQFALGALERAAFVHLPGRHRRRARRWIPPLKALNARLGLRPRLRPDTERALRDRYRADVLHTADLIGRDLSGWLES